jgi:hypothetical protein
MGENGHEKESRCPSCLTDCGACLYFTDALGLYFTDALEKVDAAPASPPRCRSSSGTVAQHNVPMYFTGVGAMIARSDPGANHQYELHRAG